MREVIDLEAGISQPASAGGASSLSRRHLGVDWRANIGKSGVRAAVTDQRLANLRVTLALPPEFGPLRRKLVALTTVWAIAVGTEGAAGVAIDIPLWVLVLLGASIVLALAVTGGVLLWIARGRFWPSWRRRDR